MIRKLSLFLASLSVATPALASTSPVPFSSPPASVNLSAIHDIFCQYSIGKHKGVYQGTAFVIQKGVLATANHVTEGTDCVDVTAGKPVHVYKTDKRHDFALFTGDVDAVGPYITYTCQRPNPGDYLISYGWSSVGLPDFFNPILRNNPIRVTKQLDKLSDDVPGFVSSKGMRVYTGAIAAGMSGGPVATINGVTYAVNNAGNNKTTLEYDLADTGLCTGKWDI